MADDKMKLELLLKGNDQLSSVLKKNSTLLKQFERDTNKATTSLQKLLSVFQKSGSVKSPLAGFSKQITSETRKSNAEINKLKKNLQSLGNIKVKSPTINISSDVEPRVNVRQGQRELGNLYGKKRKPKNYVERIANFNDNVIKPAGQIKDTWKSEINSLSEYTDEAKKLYLAQAKFKLINLSETDNTKAFNAVTEVVRKFGTVTRTEGIETLTDLHTALGNLDHAIEALPEASKYRFSMKTLFGDKFSDSEIESQIQNAYKFLELTGKTTKGAEEMNKTFNVITQMSNATGGRITPIDFTTMGRTGKTSIQNLTPEGMMNLSAIMQSFGAPATGTALMSLSQSLVGGIMKQPSAQEFGRLGLVDPTKIEFGKAQKIKKLLPGANKLGNLMMTDPLSAADMLRESMKKHGINTDSQKDVDKELYLLFQNRNAQALMSFLINKRPQVTKEADLAKNARNNDQMADAIPKPLKDLQKYENALIDFKTQAGIPLIKIFSQLAESATPILKIFADHPTLARWTLEAVLAGKALKLFTETSSILSGSGLISFFTRSEQSVSQFGTTLIDTENKANKTSFGNAKKSVSGLGETALESEKKIGRLKTGLSSISGTFKTTLVLAGVGLFLDKIAELQEAVADIKSQNDNLDETGKTAAYVFKNNKDYYDKIGKPFDYSRSAGETLGLLQSGNGELEKALDPSRVSWSEYLGRNAANIGTLSRDAEFPLYQKNPTFSEVLTNPIYAARTKEYQKLPMGEQTLHGMFPSVFDRVAAEIGGEKFLEGRVPHLADPQLMTAFRKEEIPSMNLPKDSLTLLESMLKHAFPTSFAASEKSLTAIPPKEKFPIVNAAKKDELNTSTQNFSGLSGQTQSLEQDFLNLQQPSSSLLEQFLSLNTNSNKAVIGVNDLATATSDAASRISNLQINPPTFAPIQIPNPQDSGSQTSGSPIGKAKGGSVTRGHTYRINEIGQEFFTPNANGSVVANDVLRNSQNKSALTRFVTISPTFHITGNNADEIAKKIVSRLEEITNRVAGIEYEMSPEKTAQRVDKAKDRYSSRA